jgi:uncharacterized protein
MGENSILRFNTRSGGRYIYDRNTGAVVPTNSIIDDVISLFQNKNANEIREQLGNKYESALLESAINFVERWKDCYNGFYKNNDEIKYHDESMMNVTNDLLKQYIDNGSTFQVVLNITEDCNLRCKYCYLSEPYLYTRNRTKNKMSVEVGKKAIDFFFDLLKPAAIRNPYKHIAVTFYGGEPFLEFNVLKELVTYAKKHTPLPPADRWCSGSA